jgi:hypothetical protein
MKYHPDELIKTFSRHLQKLRLAQTSIRYYLSDIRVFLRFVYQIAGEDKIFPEAFESYENYLKSGTLPTKTINRKLSSLRLFSAFLLKQGVLKEDVMARVKNNKMSLSVPPFRLSSTFLLLVIFIVIVMVGAFLLSSSNTNLFAPNTFTPNPMVLSKTIQTNSSALPDLLRSQSINNIAVEGGNMNSEFTVESLGKDVILASTLSKKILLNLRSGDRVFVTPTSSFVGNYYVTESKGEFTVYLSEQQKSDFSFNWMIVSNQLPIDKFPN